MLHFDERSNGSEMQLNTGDTFEIVLRENPTTGFRWHLVSSGNPVCNLLDDSFETGGGSPGSGGIHSWQFQTIQEGLGKIDLVYQRSWERHKPPAQSFVLNVHVRT
jgi:inhibitor of cysteine peptidase